MTVSRRNMLLQGCVIGAGVIAANTLGIVALAQAQGPKLRKSLTGMPAADPILSTWRDGVRLMKAASGNVSWTSFANIHGTSTGFKKCPHGNWYFLPWHRAFILSYERVVRQLTGNNDFALPYWDWTTDNHFPVPFADQTFGGNPNALFLAGRTVQPSDTLGIGTVGQGVINQILAESPYETFGTSRPVGQNSLAQSWVTNGSGTQGTLEGNPHNTVHGWVGGLMGGWESANDPIFMMHHCNIDRIWWLWNQAGGVNSAETNWTNMPFTDNFFNPDGTFYSPKVSDLYVPESLGYTYDETPPITTPTSYPPVVVAQNDKYKNFYGVANVTTAKIAGIAAYVAEVKEPATPAKYADIPVTVDVNELKKVAYRRAASSGYGTALGAAKVRERAAAGPRAYAFIRDIDYTDAEQTVYRVFIDCDYLSASTPITDKSYVGSFSFFGPSHGSHDGKPSIVVDLTTAMQRVYGPQPEPKGSIRVQIQPVPNKASAAGKAGTCKPSRVEVAIVSA